MRVIGVAIRAALWTLLASARSWAEGQGGPPLITDDPETPGDGKWEIFLATVGSRTHERWDVSVPDVDINYGLGEHIQLKVDTPMLLGHEDGGPNFFSIGAPILGLKWRFLDQAQAGFAASVYPQFAPALAGASVRHHIVESQREFYLPIEVSTEVAGFGLNAETGYKFVHESKSEWIWGMVAGHPCGPAAKCLLEVRETLRGAHPLTLLNLGVTHALTDAVSLVGAVGHEFAAAADSQSVLIYLGIRLDL